mmetsp:Transcript_62455/g.197208  ORF Transcript_62455/g.197208 Transcript_62455/m.197208 type:complete len:247 (+) Transcript_62455:35-775(+)
MEQPRRSEHRRKSHGARPRAEEQHQCLGGARAARCPGERADRRRASRGRRPRVQAACLRSDGGGRAVADVVRLRVVDQLRREEGPRLVVRHRQLLCRVVVHHVLVGVHVDAHLPDELGVESADLAGAHLVGVEAQDLVQGKLASGLADDDAVGRLPLDVAPPRPARQEVRAVLVHAERVPEVRHTGGSELLLRCKSCRHGCSAAWRDLEAEERARAHAGHAGSSSDGEHVVLGRAAKCCGIEQLVR